MSLGMTREQLVAYAKEVFESDKVARKDPIYGRPASSTELLLAMGVLEHLSNPPEEGVPVAWMDERDSWNLVDAETKARWLQQGLHGDFTKRLTIPLYKRSPPQSRTE